MYHKIKKIVIFIFFISFLGVQVLVSFRVHSDYNYWPFKKYPMYAKGEHPGASIKLYELRLKSPENEKIVDNDSLHIMPARFDSFIRSAYYLFDSVHIDKKPFYSEFSYLNYLIKRYEPNSVRGEIWSKSYQLTENGIKKFDINWKLSSSWNINNALSYSSTK